MIIIQILVMVAVKLALLRKVMYDMEEPFLVMTLAHFAPLKANLLTMIKIGVFLNEEMG